MYIDQIDRVSFHFQLVIDTPNICTKQNALDIYTRSKSYLVLITTVIDNLIKIMNSSTLLDLEH